MAAPAVPVTAKPSIIKRQPVIIGTAVVSLLATVAFEATTLGLGSSPIVKIIAVIVAVATTFGIHTNVTPVAMPKDAKGNVLIPKPDILHQP